MAEARSLARRAREAQSQIAELPQERIDAIVDAMAKAVAPQCEPLARLAVEETGYGVVAQHKGRMLALDGGVVETSPGLDAGRRLAAIHERIGRLLEDYKPDALALEDLYFGANARSAFAVGQARGVVLLAAGQRGIPTASYTPFGAGCRSR